MIYDKISNIENYKGIYPNLDIAINYIVRHDLSTLKVGKHEIAGEDVFINVVDAGLVEEHETVYELHKKYLDLHLDINGQEKIQVGESNNSEIVEKYNSDGDYELLNCDTKIICNMDETYFLICMLDEPHMPCLKTREQTQVKKAIVKIRVQ